MMNIEKSAFRQGEYVGYGGGLVWHVRKTTASDGNWVAIPQYETTEPEKRNYRLVAMRIKDLDVKLSAFAL